MRILTVLTLVLASSLTFAQGGYKLDFKVKGWKDTTVYLGNYYYSNTYIKDTAQVDREGNFSFQDSKPLQQGVYFIVKKIGKGNVKVFEFVVGANQKFKMETASTDYVVNMKVTGDEDNELFFKDIAYNIERNKEAESFVKVLKDSTLKEDQKKEAREGYSKINEKVMKYKRDLVAKHPGTMTGRIINAMLPLVVPETPKKADGSIDSTFQLRFYRQHYFDNFDLGDDAMLRLSQPLYKEKIKEYLEKLTYPHPDSITRAVGFLAAKAKKNPEAYYYLVFNSIIMYQLPEIMGLDEVFVNLYDQYFKPGDLDRYIPPKTKEQFREWADKVRPCTIGKKSTNLIMQDPELQPKALHDVKAKYTIVYFFSPTCGHCREETPRLVKFYNENKEKLKFDVFAVATDSSMKLMKEFIKEFKTPWTTVNGPRSYLKDHFSKFYQVDTTPMIYIIDEKKVIVAKKLPVKQLEDFLIKHEKMIQAKKAKEVSVGQKTNPGK
ncbi:hypothetical protein WSM22_00450 [Cytophagales bacterium WSM2-2]|nr:hypothetical protein WSM22_00450 [Cytophagales bacterium WSM2-2]